MKLASRLRLDRMAIEEAGPDPGQLAAAIHAQLPDINGPVPVHAIAYALDIVEIRSEPTTGFEAALVAPPERGEGGILINEKSSYRRQRYSIGHELCHFLNPRHQPTSPTGQFECNSGDLATFRVPNRNAPGRDAQHLRQETEANLFAIELLAPPYLVGQFLGAEPNLGDVIAMANGLAISREASARRYVGLHRQPMAVVFSKEGTVRYFERGANFPVIARRQGAGLGTIPPPNGLSGLSDLIFADPGDWLRHSAPERLTIQTLHQQDGYAITLLTLAAADLARSVAW